MREYQLLLWASVAFVLTHFIMSHPLRPALSRFFKGNVFLVFYSLVSLGTFGWMIWEFARAPKEAPLWDAGDVGWALASLFTLLAAILFTGSFGGNPALPNAEAGKLAAREPHGIFLVTRHPMMWAFALWAVAHIIVAPRPDVFILMGAIIFLALVGAKAQEGKKARMIGVEWDMWRRKTTYWPRFTYLVVAGPGPWIAGILIWLAVTYAHPWLGWPVAGIWHWLG